MEFELYLRAKVKSASQYINNLEKLFEVAPIKGYSSIYDIEKPEILEDFEKTKNMRNYFLRNRNSIGSSGLAGLKWYIRFLKSNRDSYFNFLNYFEIDSILFFRWGIEAMIFPPMEQVDLEWRILKSRILNGEVVFIGGTGKGAGRIPLYIDFYNYVFGNKNVQKDTNNKIQIDLKNMTDLDRKNDINNYQVYSIWSRSRNIFLYEAPWNVCYIPNMIDLLLCPESKGDLPEEFRKYFLKYVRKKYWKYINDYNRIIDEYKVALRLKEFCEKNTINDLKFMKEAMMQLSPIIIR